MNLDDLRYFGKYKQMICLPLNDGSIINHYLRYIGKKNNLYIFECAEGSDRRWHYSEFLLRRKNFEYMRENPLQKLKFFIGFSSRSVKKLFRKTFKKKE